MRYTQQGCDVWLVKGGRVVTRFKLDLPPARLVEEIVSGQRTYHCFAGGGKLAALQRETQVIVCLASEIENLDVVMNASARHTLVREGPPHEYRLTTRQRQVLNGLANGQTLAGIAYRLGIRTRSVRHHVDALKRRYQAVSLTELVTRALAAGEDISTPPQGGSGAGRRSDP